MSSFKDESIPGVLVLEDPDHPEGVAFDGFLFGAEAGAEAILAAQKTGGLARDRGYGEVCFNTSLTGYQEILTDPSYYGQIICMTVPHIGNTGVNQDDPESPHPWCAGFVTHELSDLTSNWRADAEKFGELDTYLKENGIPGLYGLDTRALTRHIRTRGALRGVILPSSERAKAKELLAHLPKFEGRDLIGEVSTKEAYRWPHPKASAQKVTKIGDQEVPPYDSGAKGKKRHKVVVLDFGTKWNLLRSLDALGCDLEVLPASSSAKDILGRKPDGVFLTNGPGDPAAAPYAAATVGELIGKVPLFGVCMGHQILSLAKGAKTFKLKFGHRGGNQPVLEVATGRVEITAQNHGYAVDEKTLPSDMRVTHVHLNDRTVSGVEVTGGNAFSVQYHPESCPGPHDSRVLFERFIALMDADA
jgi:carbamoyl-phosphate synthase small subunit